jgi:hypothetical protein
MQKKYQTLKMKIERTGFLNGIATMHEGIIYQSNFHNLGEIDFCYYPKDYDDPHGIYSDSRATVAKFTIKSKLPF